MTTQAINLNPQANLAQNLTWTGMLTMTGLVDQSNTSHSSIGLAGGVFPAWVLANSNAGTNAKIWQCLIDNGGGFNLQALNDAAATNNVALVINRTGFSISSIQIGSSLDNPTISFPGTGIITTGGPLATYRGNTASTASGTAVTLATLPNVGFATYMVTATLNNVNDTGHYNAVSMISTNGTDAKANSVIGAGLMTISLSGLNVQATQSSGAANFIFYSIVRLA